MLLWLCYWHTSSGLKRTCWTTASWRWCLGLEVVSSIPTGSTKIYRFLHGCLCVSLCQNIKTKPTNMYIASARAQFKINTHGCWNWPLCIPDGLSVVQCSLGHVIGIVFLHNFCGMKWTCWTHGSWQCCPSLEVVSLIPAGSTIIYRSFVGLYAFSCARASKLNQLSKCIEFRHDHQCLTLSSWWYRLTRGLSAYIAPLLIEIMTTKAKEVVLN